jgi:hypothetical protein
VNLWMKRAIGAAALGGSLLALGAGAASAQEVSTDASARLGRPTSAEVRVCADGRVLSRLVGSCSGQAGSGGTSATVQAGRDRDGSGIRARVGAPRLASADVSLGTRRSRPRAAASAQASLAPRSRAATADADAGADTSPRARADAAATLSRPGAGRLLDLRALVSLAGEAPAGIGVLESGPIASGNQVGLEAGDVSPSVPVTVCGNGAGLLGDASASCGADTSSGGVAPPPGATSGSTDTDGISGTPGSIGTLGISGTPGFTGTSGIPGSTGTTGTTGTTGLTLGTGGGAGDPIIASAPLRPIVSASGALPFTGAASDLLALAAAGLRAVGVVVVRAIRPATAATKGGDGR